MVGIDEKLFDAFHVPLVSLGLVADVFKLFFGDELGLPHFLGTLVVGVEDLGFGFPVVEIGVDAGGLGAGGFEFGGELAVIELGQELSLVHAGADFSQYLGDDALALGGDIDLILHDDRA